MSKTTQTQEATEQPVMKVEIPKIKSICVDTFTGFQKNQVLEKWDKGKANHDDWRDFGTEIVLFIKQLRDRGFTIACILGYEGSGKSFGMKALPPKTNIWFNADDKESTYKGGNKEYGTRSKPTHYMKQPKTYDQVFEVIDKAKANGMLAERPVAFLLGHIEDFKSVDGKQRQRLKTLGKLTSKVNIEDMFEMCYYTEVSREGEKVIFKLRTQNSGADTCRSMESQHETIMIDNNFQLIIDSIENY